MFGGPLILDLGESTSNLCHKEMIEEKRKGKGPSSSPSSPIFKCGEGGGGGGLKRRRRRGYEVRERERSGFLQAKQK